MHVGYIFFIIIPYYYALLCFYFLGMIGYGLAKGAVHQLIQSLAQPGGGLPDQSTVAGILP